MLISQLLAATACFADIDPMEEVTVTGEDQHELADFDPRGVASACKPPDSGRDEWIDRLQRMIYQRVCRSALWFDGFFGDARYDQLHLETHGRIAALLEWDERDGISTQFRFRSRVPLPQLNDRISAFLGRTNEEEFVSNRGDGLLALPSEFRDATDDEWLAGLGYNPLRGDRSRLDFDVGMRLNFPAEPFVRGAYRVHHFIGKQTLLRFRETAFWQREEGFGATTRLDVERLFGEANLLRLSNSATVAQFVEGVDWSSQLTLFRNLSQRRAIAFQLEISGETNALVPLRDYGARVFYRQRILRDWLFLDLRTSLTWPKQLPEENRDLNPGVGIGFEMLFGRRPRGDAP